MEDPSEGRVSPTRRCALRGDGKRENSETLGKWTEHTLARILQIVLANCFIVKE
jgi:hypothetical protein